MVDVDLEQFFDRVNHDVLMGRLEKRIGDRRVLRLIRRYLEAGMLSGLLRQPMKAFERGDVSNVQRSASGKSASSMTDSLELIAGSGGAKNQSSSAA